MMMILTRGGWYRRKHGALACVTPAIGIVPGRHAIHRHRAGRFGTDSGMRRGKSAKDSAANIRIIVFRIFYPT